MTVLIIIWAVLLLAIILVYKFPGYRTSREMIKIDPAPKTNGPDRNEETKDKAA